MKGEAAGPTASALEMTTTLRKEKSRLQMMVELIGIEKRQRVHASL